MNATFWFTAGVLTGATVTAVSMPLWRGIGGAFTTRPRAYVIGAAAVAVFACSAALLYLAIGSPSSLQPKSSLSTALAHPSGAANGTSGKPRSMEEATAGLEARLEREGGTAEEWELLAKSYEFLGRSADESRARARAAGAGTAKPSATTENEPARGPQDAGMPSLADVASQARLLDGAAGVRAISEGTGPRESAATSTQSTAAAGEPLAANEAQRRAKLEHQVKTQPRDASAWLELADLYRRDRNPKAAQAAYERLTGLHAMTAQAWADYADVLGGEAGNSLTGAAGHAIDQALALDPKNPKALWLDASRALQEKHYSEALNLWQRLRSVLPADSPDIQLVDANIAEAESLVQGPSPATARMSPPMSDPASAGLRATRTTEAEISGTVSVESRLASRVEPGATLFIYAKAVDSPGPPLAVLRLTASGWPVSFRLDDSMAMIPARRLSQFQKVIVEARISRTGQAAPAAGDLYVTSDVLTPSSGKKLALIINHEIG
jgi:cytochrome c-type biogenesis protein CcmH